MLKKLRAKRAALVAEMRAIITKADGESRELNAEEVTAYDAKKDELETLKAKIARLEGLEGEEISLTASAGSASRTAVIPRPGGAEAKKEFESLGHFLSTVRFNPNDQRLAWVEGAGASAADLSAEMRMDNNTSGGYMVPKEFRPTIMQVQPQDALVRPRAQPIAGGDNPDAAVSFPALDQDTANNPDNVFGGFNVHWTAEGETIQESDAKLREITLQPKEVSGFVTISDKLLRNWQAAGPFMESLMRQGVAAAEDTAFLSGDGVARPLGVLNSGAMKYINRAGANVIGYPDLVGMVGVLLMRGGSPVWSMSQSCLPQIAQLKDTLGNLIWAANARDGFAGNLLGYPVRWNNRAPALGTKGDVSLLDLSYYLIKDGSGPFVAASEHVKFTQNKTVVKIVWNVDGSPWLKAPFKEENGYQVSPFVGLDVPS